MSKILLDVGGTFIKCSDGRSVPVDSNGTREEIIAAFREAVGSATEVRAAVPGPFDYATGHFLMKHKFAAVYDEYFADLIGLPRENCRFIHDVNCMLLGEVRNYASHSRNFRNCAIIALGTGLGFAMCVNGEILKGELGSPKVSIFNRPYREGVLEDYASKRGVLRLYGRDDLTVKEVADKAHAGEQKAIDAFASMGTIIGEAIAPIMEEYKIETLLLGGQISRSHDLFEKYIAAELPECIKEVKPISDFDNATFRGLAEL